MVKVYIKNIYDISLNELNIAMLPESRRLKIGRIKSEVTKRQSLTAGTLLNKYISDKEIKKGEYGKPYVDSGEQFNLSHSGDYVILAVSDGAEVGCDIEQLKEQDYLRMGRVVYTDSELEILCSSKDMRDKFFEFWTKKEALMKWSGEGFHLSPKSIDLSRNADSYSYRGKSLRFYEYMHMDYRIMICCEPSEVEFIVL